MKASVSVISVLNKASDPQVFEPLFEPTAMLFEDALAVSDTYAQVLTKTTQIKCWELIQSECPQFDKQPILSMRPLSAEFTEIKFNNGASVLVNNQIVSNFTDSYFMFDLSDPSLECVTIEEISDLSCSSTLLASLVNNSLLISPYYQNSFSTKLKSFFDVASFEKLQKSMSRNPTAFMHVGIFG